MAKEKKENELYITRIYDAPVEMVWQAWVDPKQVGQWWGPRGFTLTTKRKTVKTGGDWLYTMHGPDGTDYPNHTKFLEVDELKRLVYDHGGFEDRPPMFRVTVIFTDLRGKTKMEMTMALPTAEAAKETKKFVKKAGGDATWDRLAEFLEFKTQGKDVFVIHRVFDASAATVFKFWTDPNLIMNWLPPVGFTGKFLKANIATKGESFYSMTNGVLTMHAKAQYLEVSGASKIVYTQVFTDADGKVSRHPLAPTWPEMMKVTVLLTEEDNQTRVTIKAEVIGKATSEEQQMFNDSRAGMTMGWTGSFDKLEECLATENMN